MNIVEASKLTGYTTGHLRKLAIDGTIDAEKVQGKWMFPEDSLKHRKKRPRTDMPPILEDGPALWEVYKKHGSLRQAAEEVGVSSDTMRKRLKSYGYSFKHGVGWKEQEHVAENEAPQYDLKRYVSVVSFAQKQYGDDIAALLTPCPVNCPRWLGGGEDGVDCLMSDEPCIYEDGKEE